MHSGLLVAGVICYFPFGPLAHMAPRTATALYSYNLRLPNCVTVVAGDALRVWTEYSNDEWCYVECLAVQKQECEQRG